MDRIYAVRATDEVPSLKVREIKSIEKCMEMVDDAKKAISCQFVTHAYTYIAQSFKKL
jgi:hypothetical protein